MTGGCAARRDRRRGCPQQPPYPHRVYTLRFTAVLPSPAVWQRRWRTRLCSGGMLTAPVRLRPLEGFKFPVYPPEVDAGVCCCCCVSVPSHWCLLFSCYIFGLASSLDCLSSMLSVSAYCKSLLSCLA
ncbi:hypothetical protein BO94DRAFT_74845 [Aspergillus sclerotioniger CBS 115572]|uniref:Uncharacterized protein n=1 Tax=Aspergillus sclerotioniger CBS 115572 TaxID=1450535 RepID=A0A317WLE2_9EURO|nr:hypothetical protein BO94DRAFT_74845 [Aspergillus sclerotioniger CBS 115572]PWY87316.1 hypothetical protein BO94DRAFT_74845 [Aspergillus sclerotioniger CBS 115572]